MMFYTIGFLDIYEDGIQRLGADFRKRGRDDQYAGGIVFLTEQTARDYILLNLATPENYGVYGLICKMADCYLADTGQIHLLTGAQIVPLES